MNFYNDVSLKNYLDHDKKFLKDLEQTKTNPQRPENHQHLKLKSFHIQLPQRSGANKLRKCLEKKSRCHYVKQKRSSFSSSQELKTSGIRSLEKKNIKRNDIYLFNSENLDEEITKKLCKLRDKLTEANFDVKLIKNFENVKALNTQKLIRHSSVFFSIVNRFIIYSETFKKEILFAYESCKRIALILLEEIDTQQLDQNLKKIIDISDIYPFYQDQKALDKIIPIQFNNFLFQLNHYVQSDCTFSGTRNSNLKFINIEKKHGKKKRRKIKRKRRKKRSIKSFKFLHNKKKKVKKIKTKNKKFRLKFQTKKCIKTDYLEVVADREESNEKNKIKKRTRLYRYKVPENVDSYYAANSTTTNFTISSVIQKNLTENAKDILPEDSLKYDLMNCFKNVKKQVLIEIFETNAINITRGVLYDKNRILSVNHEDNALIELNLENNSLTKVTLSDQLKTKLPYSIRPNFNLKALYLSFKDESIVFKQRSLITEKHKEFTFKTSKNENFTRIWDIAVDDLTGYFYILDINLKTINVFDNKFKFHREVSLLGKEKFWPRDMRIVKNRLYVIDTCTCLYDFTKSKLISFTDGGNCIRLFDTESHRMVKCIKHKSLLRPLGIVVDKNENIFTTANFMNNYNLIAPHQYLFCFNKAGKILHVTCLNVDLRAKGISDIIFVNAEKLVFTSLTSGYIICEFDKKKNDS